MAEQRTCFLCGIGGSGMSALAQVLAHQGHRVRGSDRGFDQGQNQRIREALLACGVQLYPQDGSGVDAAVTELVVSSAVEPTIPDVQAAQARRLPIRKRAEVLAEYFNATQGIAIGGTSGKSTVTAMVGHLLASWGRHPTVINGAVMRQAASTALANVRLGRPDLAAIEVDESDGTIACFRPLHAIITNISLDHKPLPELRTLFGDFCAATRGTVVLNADCRESMALLPRCRRAVTFALENRTARLRPEWLRPTATGTAFSLGNVRFHLPLPGRHNVANALAAIAGCLEYDVRLDDAAAALATFAGVERRLQLIGTRGDIAVVDDFAHNPDKIAAALAALRLANRRLLVCFQPHGFGPTRFLREGLVRAFAEGLGADDWVVMPEIYYAGGTADQSISARDLCDGIRAAGRQSHFAGTRPAARDWLLAHARPGDTLVVMGARDSTLPDFARDLLAALPAPPVAK